jgi:hypothetical protein
MICYKIKNLAYKNKSVAADRSRSYVKSIANCKFKIWAEEDYGFEEALKYFKSSFSWHAYKYLP